MIKRHLAPALKPGDTIGVFSPSSWVEKADIKKSVSALEKKGLKVFVHPQTYERLNQSAGTHLQKTLAFQGLWQREDIKAIWAAGGGNRAMYLLDTINFNKLKAHPKILIGYSDVTSLLNAVYADTGIVTFHAQVFKNVHKWNELDHFLNMLSGKKEMTVPFADDTLVVRQGKATGHLMGGNLSIFQYMIGTLPAITFENAVIFLEDCNEELSRIDRMLLHLKRTGILKKSSALLLGQFTSMLETARPYGFKFEDIVSELTENLDIPVIMNLPFGHGKTLYSLPVGAPVTVDTSDFLIRLDDPVTQI
ncbi:MAG: LD-carboxypeptidase [Alphaproteobacteria bacterium]|nr:LD-carboxypeptidase [Alphaproteobacteria bacterium]MCB9974817.1 LD-carboxypeptidase [Rhodospirillales bacterium]